MTTAVARWLTSRPADIAWRLMAAVALLLSVMIGVRQVQMTSCQARYNESANSSTRARAEAAEADRQALDELLRVVADQPDAALSEIRRYNMARAQADEQRRLNPVPPSPQETCG
ncbi:hypothetical protein AMIS_2340 [Actinoplanes missouriensis 431]|uniref:Uncharacterized protein n=1 Tax=Actinoplanes missouriensis (strain ATCC 14538 / DSM 43046 / CBS 188.64 / JCM 3121 / NBRC 102363 / NCIMB 12654 / NRRL B-3342 / UNCC 431) TaxID=512565 RepID=I0GXG7_ACTM4|nr:hypothetical protein [Actinoplanes missouriensis]KOX45257.1 hypothetical protein ADL19_23310 [Streptomyces purpurogeneiscleroticus]BAL85454.1 hypothetical protein AMIS_2340 [Actinoplanes missouriensis 431]